uniref:HAT C-terminal dimerisation domain-containing protein n=1 Tax=Ditylenchus dipsaci TaxID=166011 RepID=A0A915DXU0_9BILA
MSCISIVKDVEHSHQSSQELALLTDKALISLSATRWGSVIQVIKRFLELQESVVVIARRKNWPIPSNSNLEDWHALAVSALQVLSVPATSALIERIFSQAGLATRGLRNQTNYDYEYEPHSHTCYDYEFSYDYEDEYEFAL